MSDTQIIVLKLITLTLTEFMRSTLKHCPAPQNLMILFKTHVVAVHTCFQICYYSNHLYVVCSSRDLVGCYPHV